MIDQAERLRDLVNQHNVPNVKTATNMRVITITSGKGGVGKTNFALNLAIYLARTGKRVVIIDADFGLANVELLLGVSPKYSFKEVLEGNVTVVDALTEGPEGVLFLSGGSGLAQLADVTDAQMAKLISSFNDLDAIADILIIDTGAGMSKTVTNFIKASHETIVVTTSDPTAITDAYAVMKVISADNAEPPLLKIVINRVENHKEGIEVFGRLQRVCSRFLNLQPINLGSIPYDRNLARAVKAQEPVATMYPNAESSRSIEFISKRLLDENVAEVTGVKRFIDRWVGFMRK